MTTVYVLSRHSNEPALVFSERLAAEAYRARVAISARIYEAVVDERMDFAKDLDKAWEVTVEGSPPVVKQVSLIGVPEPPHALCPPRASQYAAIAIVQVLAKDIFEAAAKGLAQATQLFAERGTP